MKSLDVVLKYMDIFFTGKNMEDLRPLLANGCKFRGPFYQFDTAEDYINALKEDPPQDFKYEILQSYENESSVCLVYQFSKPGVSTPMAQVFDFREDKICKILLIFDTEAFT